YCSVHLLLMDPMNPLKSVIAFPCQTHFFTFGPNFQDFSPFRKILKHDHTALDDVGCHSLLFHHCTDYGTFVIVFRSLSSIAFEFNLLKVVLKRLTNIQVWTMNLPFLVSVPT